LAFAVGVVLLFYGLTQSPSQSSAPENAPPELVVQTGHSSRINCAVFAPDHRWLASGSADNTIRLWDVESGRELRALHGHKNWVKSLAVNRNGELLASGSNDRTVKLWNVSSGREIQTLGGHGGPVEAVLFSPDDRWIISGSTDNTIRVWDAGSGREVQTLKGHASGITALAISPDGKTLASGSGDNSIKLWDTANWSPLRTLNKHLKKITTLTFGRDGKSLLSGSDDGLLVLWELAGGRDLRTMKYSSRTILATGFTSDEEVLATSADGMMVFWDAKTGKQKRAVPGDSEVGALLFACLSNDGGLMASSMGDRLVELRSPTNGKVLRTLESRAASFLSVAFSHDGRWLAAGTNDRTIRVWQIATGREMPRLAGHKGWVTAVAFSPDSRWLASASNSGEFKLWDMNGGREVYTGTYSQEMIHSIAFSPDGKWLAAAGTGRTVHLLNLVTKQERILTGHTGEITSLAFVPNSSLIASGSTDKTIGLWDLTKGAAARTSVQLSDEVNAIAINPDGTMLAAGTADSKIALFSLANVKGGEARTMSGHNGEIFTLSFSRDGRWLASGGMDQTVRLWDPKTGAEVRTLLGVSGEINGIDFSNDSRWLISAHGDGSMIVWNCESGTLAALMVSIPESDDWLVVTPGGLFDGSQAAWKFLLWRFDQSTFKVASVESFFNEFFYPGLIADIFANKNPKAKQDILRKDRRQPQIILRSEEYPLTESLAKRTVRLKMDITEAPSDAEHGEGSGARDLRLFRNGLLVQTWSGDVLRGSPRLTIEASVPIVAGENDFTAYAFNRENIKSTDAQLSIHGSETLRREGTAYLLVVGVGSYANSQYNLNYSVADATDIGAELKSQQELLRQYRPVEVISLFNADATKENILLALKLLAGSVKNPLPKEVPAALLKIKAAQPEDAVIFYFSGHGTAKEDRFYLIPYDLGYQGLRSTLNESALTLILSHSISDRELEEVLKPMDVGQLLLIIDACNSGQILKADDERRGPMNTKGIAQLAYEKGMYVLTASQSDEVAFESAGLQHSYLTYALVEEGIKSGLADLDHNGQILLNEWFDYATKRVPRIAVQKSLSGKQLEEIEPDEKRIQRPKVFNMREGGAERFIIARTATDGRQ
jgi:WD40 repeat protein/uncharacterized caspase-like protein